MKTSKDYGVPASGTMAHSWVQIFENEYWGAEHTNIIAHDVNYNVYYVYLYGYCENVYENSYIQLTALPLDYFTYPNTSGKKIWAIACAGVMVE